MRYAIGGAAALTIVAFTRTRTWQRILWHLFTADVRRTHPHLYGRKRA